MNEVIKNQEMLAEILLVGQPEKFEETKSDNKVTQY